MSEFFHAAAYQPIYNLLIFLYDTIPGSDFGLAIIALTIFLKVLLIPLSQKQIESQKKLQEIQPKMKEIQKKYKDNREEQSRAMMAFYRENKVNPFSGCLPLIIQLIVLIVIYRVLYNISQAGFVVSPEVLYSFVSNPHEIQRFFLSVLDLSKPSVLLAVMTGLAQYAQMKMMINRAELKKNALDKSKKSSKNTIEEKKEPDFAEIMTKQMLYVGPALTLFFGITFPSGIVLYWFVSTLFMIAQQWYLLERRA